MSRQQCWGGLLLIAFAVALIGWSVSYHRGQTAIHSPIRQREAGLAGVIARSFELVDERQDRFSRRTTYSRADQVLRLETIAELDPDSAATVVHEGVISIEALYANALSDYPDDLSQKVATPPRFQPIFVKTNDGKVPGGYYSLYATDRLTFGAVSEDTAKRRALVGWIYGQSDRTLYRLELFAPASAPAQSLADYFLSLSCE